MGHIKDVRFNPEEFMQILIGDCKAGAGWNTKVPEGGIFALTGVHGQLITDGNVANRQIRLTGTTGISIGWVVNASLNIVANQTTFFQFRNGFNNFLAGSNAHHYELGSEILFPDGGLIASTINNVQAGDRYIQIVVEGYFRSRTLFAGEL